MAESAGYDHMIERVIGSITDYAIYALDPQGCVTSWGAGAERLTGHAEAEVLGRHVSEFFTPQDRAVGAPEHVLKVAEREGRARIDGWRVRKDGRRFWAEGVLHAMRDDRGGLAGYAEVLQETTARREAHETLAHNERRLQLLVEGVIDHALVMLDPNGVVTSWNRGAQQLTGWIADEIVGRHLSTFYTPEDRAAGLPAQALAAALRDGRLDAEGWRMRKDGSRFWASVVTAPVHDDAGRPMGYAIVARDITEQREAQEALAASERQFRTLVSGVVDYAIFMLDPNGIVTNWNAGAQHIKGYTADEIVGRHFSAFYTEEDRAAGTPARALKAATDNGRYEAEGWRMRKDGSLFWASVIIDAIREDDGGLIGFAKITRDITEKRQAQIELQRAHDRLAQSQKMEALGKLTGGVAHDFNNLLMVVSGQAQLLRRKVGDDSRALRALDAIEAAAHRGEDLTRHLLTFARRQRLTPRATSLSERARGLGELISTSLPANVRLDIRLPDALWPVTIDPSEFELAVLNLAVNARDAMPNGGDLILTAENLALDGNGPDGLQGDFVALSVTDTGSGIAPDILPKIFDPFFTTKEVDKGTGLGLSQVFGFARQSGGMVGVESQLGHGARFTLYLPRAGTGALPGLEEAEPPPQAGSARILLVEDNPDVADVAARMLEELGHEVRVSGSGAAGLKALAEGEPVDLVFSDIVMAGDIDGLGMARRIREQHPDCPILLATGYSEAAERIGDEFPILRKPYRLPELNRALAQLLAPRGGSVVDLATARKARAPK